MKGPKVFIASSSEGYNVTNALRRSLKQKLGRKAEVSPWKRKFDYGKTYIESLEKAAQEADFAVLVLTSDDIVTSRKKRRFAPRDNVVFELGLFMGYLGRERCIIVHKDETDLKLPTDLLGIHAALFERPARSALKAALESHCLSMSERMTELGVRHKPSPETLAAQARIRSFCGRVEGTWWERMAWDDEEALSFFSIEPDERFNSIRLGGKSYNRKGSRSAKWCSLMAHVETHEDRILYLWEGRHVGKGLPKTPFHGFGIIDFDKPADSGNKISSGEGRFWNVDEAHPEKTIVKEIEIRRVREKSAIKTMTGGRQREVTSLIRRTLKEW